MNILETLATLDKPPICRTNNINKKQKQQNKNNKNNKKKSKTEKKIKIKHKTQNTKQKQYTIHVSHHYVQTNAKHVNKTRALLETIEVKIVPNIFLMRKL